MESKNRDFVDFVIELVARRRVFYFILLVLLALAYYFDTYKNHQFKIESTIKIAPESVLMPIVNNINIYNTSEDVFLANPLQKSLSYEDFAVDMCGLISSTFIDAEFHISLADDFISKNPSTNLQRKELINEFQGALSNRPASDSGICMVVDASSNYSIINYLRQYYGSMVNMYIRNEINKRLFNTRDGKIEFLTKSLESLQAGTVTKSREEILSTLELNALEERRLIVISKLDLVRKTPNANADISYFIYRVSNIQKNLDSNFIYAFAIFMSFILHVLLMVINDFRNQYLQRKK